VLALYDPKLKAKISADASLFGLGAVLLRLTGNNWKPAANPRDLSVKQSVGMRKLRSRPLPSRGHVKSSEITSWGN